MSNAEEHAGRTELRCSFCDKSQRYVRKLVAGPNVQICDECVDICVDVLVDDPDVDPNTAGPQTPGAHHVAGECSLCRMATPLKHLLDVGSRGALCPGCVDAIEAAVAASREEG